MNISTSIKRLLPLMMLSLMLGSCEKEKAYALDTCVVSGKPLGSMGKPVSFTHEGTEVRICCKSCRKEFDAHPAKYMAKLK